MPVKKLSDKFFAEILAACLRQQEEKLSKAFAGSDDPNLIECRKSLH
jgi:hypothetical protein